MINMVQILKQIEKIEEKTDGEVMLTMFSDGSGNLEGENLEEISFDDMDELEKIMKELLR